MVNDHYPETEPGRAVPKVSYEALVCGITGRGMDSFVANGPHIVVDTTDFRKVDSEAIVTEVKAYIKQIL